MASIILKNYEVISAGAKFVHIFIEERRIGMNFTCIIFGTTFVLIGILFAFGKLHSYFPAWKNMSLEEKETIEIIPLCRNIGGVILLSGIIFLVNGFWPSFQNYWFSAAMIAWWIVAGLDVWFISKSNRYKKQ